MGNFTGVIRILIIICVAVFAVNSLVLPEMIEWFGLFFPKNENFRFWQLVTNMFMHGGFGHIFFNMYALWAFGSPLEQRWGSKKFLLFYFLSGVGAAIIYLGVNYFRFSSIYNELRALGVSAADIENILETGKYNMAELNNFPEEKLEQLYRIFTAPAVGASGAIYGVLVAFGMMFPNAKLMLLFLPFPIAAKYFIPILIGLDLFSGLTGYSIFGGGVAHFAHVGGAIIGFLLMWYWRNQGGDRRAPVVQDM
jgi:membrane associated rhomboid family serine protease